MGLWSSEDATERLIREQAETNRLLRVLIGALTGADQNRKQTPPPTSSRIRGAEDVAVTGRNHQIVEERKQVERVQAPWRNGQASPTTSQTDGTEPAESSQPTSFVAP